MNHTILKALGHGAWAAAIILALAALIGQPCEALAQPVEVPETYGGDLSSRPRLTGNWGGLRDELGKKGVVLDVDLRQIVQGVASGGISTGTKYFGATDYTLNADTGKLGLWPGGFLKFHALSSFGGGVNSKTGAVEAVNGSALFPVPGESTTAVMNLTFMQFFSPKFGIYLGKVETLQGDANEFADYNPNKFMNFGLNLNQVNVLVPISALGGGVVLLPWEGAVFNVAVLDPNGKTTESGFDRLFADGITLAAEGRVTVKPFDLTGHQLAGFTWSNKERISLEQDPANLARMLLFNRFPRLEDPGPILGQILGRFFPGLLVPVQPLNKEEETWSANYNFDQYLWNPQGDPTRGVGVFGRFGVSDGKANPIKYHYSAGIGGKGIVPGRPRDNFGIGWSHVEFSDNLVPFLRDRLGLGLGHEDAVELFYNVAVTGWLNVTADLQVVKPGLTKTLGSSGQLEGVDTALVGGLRVYTRF